MSEEEAAAAALRWNNNVSVAAIALISYEYLLLFSKEIEYVWKRPWSLMSCLYLVVRYFGLFLAMVCACWGGLLYIPESVSIRLLPFKNFYSIHLSAVRYQFISHRTKPHHLSSYLAVRYDLIVLIEWGFSVYFFFAEVILIWRLYAICNQSKLVLHVLVGLFLPIVALSIGTDIYLYSRRQVFSVKEIMTLNTKYCTLSFNTGPMLAIYTSIPIMCYDILLVVLAVITLVKHYIEQRRIKMKPNTYMVMIVRYHIMYFVLNLTNQLLLVILWADIPTPAMSLSELFNGTAPFILAPRLIISIWDTHANEECVHVSTTFADCVCWTSPPNFEEQEMSPCVEHPESTFSIETEGIEAETA
ncbi:uncharacterized protein EDB93DRAFT_1251869 [Suillus bovinus]|uniref:uncharacterized protein n=1 Tax=Suillus bovinus TaxID=48563 RepID=UPI001B883B31|nr:uncharacterized protein EDB93DRAFT_1251869 [Suillus bovinus]KAG2143818.1 hypothetical protein EDB93DRAFT_1251869 [Suillus bovinus]